MTTNNLTEQWKKGELKTGWYYVKNEFGSIFVSEYSKGYDHINERIEKDFFTEVSDITEIICEVPSYEKWQELNKQRNQFIRDIKDLAHIQEENQKLKKLLNEIDVVYSSGINKRENKCDEYVIYQSTFTKLDELFYKWEKMKEVLK